MRKDRHPLAKKNPDHLTSVERSLSRLENPDKQELDVVMGVAMLLDVIYRMPKKHGFNSGTLTDQVKIVMINAFNQKGESELTIPRILELWNHRKHGLPHTRQQVASAIQALKEQGHVITAGSAPRADGSPGKPATKYALVSVIERLTNPDVPVGVVKTEEPEIKTVEIDGEEIEVTESDSPVGIVLTKLTQLKYDLNLQFKAIESALQTADGSNTEMRESYNKLIVKLHGAIATWTEIHDHNQNANNQNWTGFTEFVDNTNGNFLELASYFKDIQTALSHLKTDGSNSNFDNRYYEHQITQAYRAGYKEGFTDGRKEYKSELTAEFRPGIEKSED
jgi:hypothetical protein